MKFADLTLGNYYPAASPVHRLDPRLKIAAMALLMAVTFAVERPVGVALHTILLLATVTLSRIPLPVFLRGLRLFIWLFIFTAVLHLFFTPGTPVANLPSLGVFTVTVEGLERGGLVSWRLLSVIGLSALFTQTTTPMEITRGMESLLKPLKRLGFPVQDFSLMMMIAIRFIPVLSEETQRVWKAQRSRGADLSQGSLRERSGNIMSIIVPVFTGVFRRADELALALESRGYEPGRPRTSMKELRAGRADAMAALLVSTWCLLAIWTGVFGL